jgi:hypothetical protein
MKCVTLSAFILLFFPLTAVQADGERGSPIRVPFDLLVTKHIVVNVKINDHGPYRMIFDTGAPVSILNTKSAKETGLISKTGGGLFSLFGSMEQVKIKKLELGELKAESVPIVIMDHPTVQLASRLWGPIEGIIGFPFFARYRMTLDYQAKEFSFVPSDYVPGDILQTMMAMLTSNAKSETVRLSPPAVWGFCIEKDKSDGQSGVAISNVLSGSPAAKAGLEVGDRLLSLDDRWTDSIADCYAAAQEVAAGTSAKVRVHRDGKELELVVTPEPGI